MKLLDGLPDPLALGGKLGDQGGILAQQVELLVECQLGSFRIKLLGQLLCHGKLLVSLREVGEASNQQQLDQGDEEGGPK